MNVSLNSFRWDVQGLRALAVLAVVIFHINPRLLPGGYLGVDIFFVISGYLIIGFIQRDINLDKFKLLDFYSRRVKRLFPALFAMIFIVTIAVYLYMLPEETASYAESMISSLLYVSNFYFYFQSDYFNTELHLAPLLHTWSLSVEEQFYIIFPLLLLLINKVKVKKILTFLILFTLLGLVLSEMLLRYDPSLAFYISPSRFWQFSAGGILSLLTASDLKHKKNILFDVVGALSLLVLLLSFFLYDEYVLFPGVNALIPTIATLLVIWSGGSFGLIYKLLSIPPARFFGNISYSLYLWHWPVIVFYKLVITYSISKIDQLLLLLISTALGYLSYKWIELPFKNTQIRGNTNKPILLSFGISLLASLIAVWMMGGVEHRFNSKQLRYSSFLEYSSTDYTRAGTCFLTSTNSSYLEFDRDKCIQFDEDKKNILLIGDSHASHWYSAMYSLKDENESISQVNSSGCKPTIEYKGREACVDLMQWGIESLVKEKQFDEVVISARWNEQDVPYLLKTIESLTNHAEKIIVLGPIVEYEVSLPRLLASSNDLESLEELRVYEKIKSRDDYLRSELKKLSITYVSVLDLICVSNEECKVLTVDDIPYQFDYGHLTHEGAMSLFSKIKLGL